MLYVQQEKERSFVIIIIVDGDLIGIRRGLLAGKVVRRERLSPVQLGLFILSQDKRVSSSRTIRVLQSAHRVHGLGLAGVLLSRASRSAAGRPSRRRLGGQIRGLRVEGGLDGTLDPEHLSERVFTAVLDFKVMVSLPEFRRGSRIAEL